MIKLKEKVTPLKKGQYDLLFLLIMELMEKCKEKELVSYEVEEMTEKKPSDPKVKWETYGLTGSEEIRVFFSPREEKDEG